MSSEPHPDNLTTATFPDQRYPPVKKGLVKRASDWKSSSASWFEDLTPNPLHLDPIPQTWLE